MSPAEHSLVTASLKPWAGRHDDGATLGAKLKTQPEDFEVREEPAYVPSGTGNHLLLWVRKRAVSHRALLGHVARQLAVAEGDIGAAGQKDTQALTWQQLSVPASPDRLARLAKFAANDENIIIERYGLHPGKLKTGHLRANHFVLRLRELTGGGSGQDPKDVLKARLAALKSRGLLNFFGPQRFGREGSTLRQGLALMGLGERVPRLSGQMRRLALSAVQSALFNRWLNLRLDDGLAETVLEGDLMQVVASGGPFWAEDVAEVNARREAGLVAISGPIFGPKMRQPRGQPLQREQQILADAGLTLEHFAAQKKLCLGTRRPAVVPLGQLALEFEDAKTAVLRFALPPGTYATTLLAHLLDEVP